jgi:hypothetical protein
MTEHQTKVKVSMSFFVNVPTESHPECIDEETMKRLIAEYSMNHLEELTEDEVEKAIDDFDFHEVKETVETRICKFCRREDATEEFHFHQGGYVCEGCWDERLRVTE